MLDQSKTCNIGSTIHFQDKLQLSENETTLGHRLPKRFAKNTKEQKKGHPHSSEEEDQRLPAHFPNQAFGKHYLQFKTELRGKLARQ